MRRLVYPWMPSPPPPHTHPVLAWGKVRREEAGELKTLRLWGQPESGFALHMLWDIRSRYFPSWNLSFLINNMETILGSVLQGWAAVVESLSCVQLFAAPWTAALQAPLSFTVSLSLLKLMSIESGMPSNHLILCRPLLLLPSIFPSIRVIPNELALCISWPRCWEEVNKITQERVEQGAQQRPRPGQRLPSLLLLTLVGDPCSPVSSLGISSTI